jgi:trk system potassium uptake protein TrkH
VARSVLGFFALYAMLTALAIVAVAACGADLVTATGSVIACVGNIGPGLGAVGPTENYLDLPAGAKAVLTACMLLGRLELFTVLALFLPSFWRR